MARPLLLDQTNAADDGCAIGKGERYCAAEPAPTEIEQTRKG